jgi:hypothetical protein
MIYFVFVVKLMYLCTENFLDSYFLRYKDAKYS